MNRTVSRGSALDLERAFEDKIAELSGSDGLTDVTSAVSTDRRSGSTEDMMNAVRSKIAELGSTVTSCDTQQDDENAVVLAARTPEDQDKLERYLHTLIGDLAGVLNTSGIYNTLFDYDDTNLYMTVSTDAAPATQYTIPFADLKLEFDQIDVDIDYIIDGTVADHSQESVSSAITAGYELDPGYDSELEQMGDEAAELVQRYMSGDESPYDILTSLGYDEVEDDFYQKASDKYTRTFDFRHNKNDIANDDYYCRYYVLLDDMIPAGKREVTLNLYDEALDKHHMVDEVIDETIESSEDLDVEFVEIATKQVPDSDGFMTDYTWYRDQDGRNVFVFGDKDMYTPDEGNFDWEEDNDEAAQAWFDSYTGFSDDDEDSWDTLDADDIYSCDKTSVEGAWEPGWYFGKEKAEEFGDLIANTLSGRTVSKRKDLAEAPGGLIYEANQLGIDMWDLLEALEGMCYQNRAHEIDDSTYQIL